MQSAVSLQRNLSVFPLMLFFLLLIAALWTVWLYSLYTHGGNRIQRSVSCCQEVALILAHFDGVQPVPDGDEQGVVWHVLWGVGKTDMTNRMLTDVQMYGAINQSCMFIMKIIRNFFKIILVFLF